VSELHDDDLKASDRKILFQTEAFEIVSIEWTDKRISPLHSHGWSQCLVLIEEGIFENTLDLGAKTEVQILEVGQVVSTPVGARHEMRCKSPKGKTLHVYTPRIVSLAENGKFRTPTVEDLRKEIALSQPSRIQQLKDIFTSLRSHSISTHSPYFMNQLFSGVMPQMLVAEEFSAQTKTTLATFEASPALSVIESEVVEALCQQIGWPEGQRSGVSVPGGSAANFMAIHCARHRALPEAKKKGMSGASIKIFASREAHYSFKKACAVLGIGIGNLITVPVDKKGRMQPEALDRLISETKAQGSIPLMVAATAGTTVLGAFDEITPLATVCKKHGLWLHVDGAWGGPALFSKKLRHLVQGIELADSMTFDAHKLFGAGLTSSLFLTKHRTILLEANDVAGGDYLFHSENPDFDRGRLSWQCGRKADALSFWAIWKSLGTTGLGDFVDRLVGIREETLAWIGSQDRLELVAMPDYLNICVRILPPNGEQNPNWSKLVRERMKEQDQAMVNYSTDDAGTFLRLILAHPYLKFEHVRQVLEWARAVE
jgi:glutamate/tyrosine decarboxylase-like PLP-dependent enzyme/quercetin dioxygenase-like cupin family protein